MFLLSDIFEVFYANVNCNRIQQAWEKAQPSEAENSTGKKAQISSLTPIPMTPPLLRWASTGALPAVALPVQVLLQNRRRKFAFGGTIFCMRESKGAVIQKLCPSVWKET